MQPRRRIGDAPTAQQQHAATPATLQCDALRETRHRGMRVQHAIHIRTSGIDAGMNGPLAHAACFPKTIHAHAVKVDHDQIFRPQSPPAHRTGLDEDPLFAQARAQMSGQTIARGLRSVQNLARPNQLLTECGLRRHLKPPPSSTRERLHRTRPAGPAAASTNEPNKYRPDAPLPARAPVAAHGSPGATDAAWR